MSSSSKHFKENKKDKEDHFLEDPNFKRLEQARLVPHHLTLSFFQLSDYVYSELLPQVPLQETSFLLHCHEAGNFGDLSHVFNAAKLIEKNRPVLDIHIALCLESHSKEKVESVFPIDRYKMHYLPKAYTDEDTGIVKLLEEYGGSLGMPVSIASSSIYKSHHRVLKEFGMSTHVKENVLSMGFRANEEGIVIPSQDPRSLHEIESKWIQEAISHSSKLYHLYVKYWGTQAALLYAVAMIEKDRSDSFSVVMSLRYNIKELIQWGVLDPQVFLKQGIGSITTYEPSGQNTVQFSETGKALNIISGPIPKKEMEALQQHSEAFFGCTGDLSFSEAIFLDKFPIYDVMGYKRSFFESLKQLVFSLNLKHFSHSLDLMQAFDTKCESIFESNKPKFTGLGMWRGAAVAYTLEHDDIRDEKSIARKSVEGIHLEGLSFAKNIVEAYKNPDVLAESKSFSQHVKTHCDADSRILSIVDRAVILHNYPDLIKEEKALLETYLEGKISFREVLKSLKEKILAVTSEKRLLNTPK